MSKFRIPDHPYLTLILFSSAISYHVYVFFEILAKTKNNDVNCQILIEVYIMQPLDYPVVSFYKDTHCMC